jgi:hypothetical protein
VHNTATDVDSLHVYGQYTYEQCIMKENEINKKDSELNKSLKQFKLELVETRCDD